MEEKELQDGAALSEETRRIITKMQEGEITEYHIYTRIANRLKDEKNKQVLLKIAEEEKKHCDIWKKYTGTECKPKRFKIWWYTLLSRIFGFTFAIKLMENGEDNAENVYEKISKEVPIAEKISADEKRHEEALIEMLDEERLQYVGSMVLGMSDALVELTGTLAGITFAMQNTRLIALSGLITGVSATLSMAASEFQSARADGSSDAFKSCIYTGITYLITVALLVLPYLLFPAGQYLAALITMLAIVVCVIFVFNYYICVAKSLPFKKRFLEMVCISLGVAVISFLIGLLVKQFLGIDI